MFKNGTKDTASTEAAINAIDSTLDSIVRSTFPDGLVVRFGPDHCLLCPRNFHSSQDDLVSYKLKSGERFTNSDLSYIWQRLIFRLCQSAYTVTCRCDSPLTKNDFQHLYALGLLCIGYYWNTASGSKRNIAKKIMYYVDDILFINGVPGFSGLLFLESLSEVMSAFNHFTKMTNAIYKPRPEATRAPIVPIEP